jgi:hypothetical protein
MAPSSRSCGRRRGPSRRSSPCPGSSPPAPTSSRARTAASSAAARGPFRVAAPPATFDFSPPDLTPDPALTPARLQGRRALRLALEAGRPPADLRRSTDVETLYRRAFDLFGDPAVARAFRIDREDPRLRARYGLNAFGQSLLLARRTHRGGGADGHHLLARPDRARGVRQQRRARQRRRRRLGHPRPPRRRHAELPDAAREEPAAPGPRLVGPAGGPLGPRPAWPRRWSSGPASSAAPRGSTATPAATTTATSSR